MNEIVVDACSFILWSETSLLEIIFENKLFLIFLTMDVIDELKDIESRLYLNKGVTEGMIKIVNVDDKDKENITVKYKLGKGEISCIAFCSKEGKVFVTDDIAARNKAEKEGVKVFTTKQLIVEFIRDEHISMLAREKLKRVYPHRFSDL